MSDDNPYENDLSDEERQYLIWHNGFLRGGDAQALESDVEHALDQMLSKTDNRIQQLVFLSRLATAAQRRRDEHLRALLEQRYRWSEHGSLAWQTWEVAQLASASGLSRTTVAKRSREAHVKTYKTYLAEEAGR